MKTKYTFWILSLLTSVWLNSALSAQAPTYHATCKNISSGSGSIEIRFSNVSQVNVILVDTSGVEDGSSTLKCDGPMQSAFDCQGKIRNNSGQIQTIDLVIPEMFFQSSPPMGELLLYGEKGTDATRFECN